MKIYTRRGDKGYTSLIGGKKVPKNHIRIEAYGAVDELVAQIGLLHDLMHHEKKQELLIIIEDRLMVCAAILASENDVTGRKIPAIHEDDVYQLEKEIDLMQEKLPELDSFILPGGHPLSSQCHIARAICRRAERNIISLAHEMAVPDTLLQYVNRLSDFLFVLSRQVLLHFDKNEIRWNPDL